MQTPNEHGDNNKPMVTLGERQESSAPPSGGESYPPAFSVDYDLILKVMESINQIGDDSDSNCACRRVCCRMLAEATGMPLAGHRLLMEKEVRPKYRKDYAPAPNFRVSAGATPPKPGSSVTSSRGGSK